MQRPVGVITIAILCFMAAAYLGAIGATMLAVPGALSMALGAPLLHGLELAGPYAFLLGSALAAVVGYGLFRLNRWARRAAILAAMAGVVMLIPTVSAAAVEFRWSLLTSGLQIMVRAAMVWYLWQEPVAQMFRREISRQ